MKGRSSPYAHNCTHLADLSHLYSWTKLAKVPGSLYLDSQSQSVNGIKRKGMISSLYDLHG